MIASLLSFHSSHMKRICLRSVSTQPKILQWLGYLAVHKYSTEIVIGNEFHGLKFDCPGEGEFPSFFSVLSFHCGSDNHTEFFLM